MKLYYLAVIALAVYAFPTISGAGEIKAPSQWTLPGRYLEKFPLDSISEIDLLLALGAPNMTATSGETIVWSYEFGERGAQSTYSFVLEDAIVVDVLYRSDGGRQESARDRQR